MLDATGDKAIDLFPEFLKAELEQFAKES